MKEMGFKSSFEDRKRLGRTDRARQLVPPPTDQQMSMRFHREVTLPLTVDKKSQNK